jgi:cell division protein FtsB
MDNRSIVQGMMVRVGLGVFGLLTLAILILTLTSDRGLLEVRRKGFEFAELQAQIHTLETENLELVQEIRNLRSEPYEIERRARENLKLVRPGEVILVLPPQDR